MAPLCLQLGQDQEEPARTWSSLLYPDASTISLDVSCLNCALRLLDSPATITIADLAATGSRMVEMYGSYVPAPISTQAMMQFGVADACTLTWDDLVTLNTALLPDGFSRDFALRSFTPDGNKMVSHRSGQWGAPVERGLCALATPYQLDVWVDHDQPNHAGTRNFHADAPVQVCTSAL